MTWAFLWLMLGLKIPIAALIYIVWWAVKDPPEPVPAPEDRGGDGNDRVGHQRHPRKPFPRRPRRGPHAGLPPAPPARMRTTRARTRTFEH
ncbi:MAG: hypothetical protein QOJ25_2477 [Solirubrobacteraceae bacterium]|nr:hypothetical protein [Solirubrobacteraceae bacterium]